MKLVLDNDGNEIINLTTLLKISTHHDRYRGLGIKFCFCLFFLKREKENIFKTLLFFGDFPSIHLLPVSPAFDCYFYSTSMFQEKFSVFIVLS